MKTDEIKMLNCAFTKSPQMCDMQCMAVSLMMSYLHSTGAAVEGRRSPRHSAVTVRLDVNM